MKYIFVVIIAFGLALPFTVVEAKPIPHGNQCVRFIVEFAQQNDVSAGFVGAKVHNCR